MRADTHTLAVEQMRLGDHAFAHYADDDVRWEVPAVFAYQGLARRVSHPVALLKRPGDLQAHHAPGELWLIGDADMATGDIFRAAVSVAFGPPCGRQLLVDLTRLCFLSTGCAGDRQRRRAATARRRAASPPRQLTAGSIGESHL